MHAVGSTVGMIRIAEREGTSFFLVGGEFNL
jgi:hypothetical protein